MSEYLVVLFWTIGPTLTILVVLILALALYDRDEARRQAREDHALAEAFIESALKVKQ